MPQCRGKCNMSTFRQLRFPSLLCTPIVHRPLFQLRLPAILSSSFASTASELEAATNVILTEEELTKINLLVPRLCHSNQLATAVRLIATALLANPPLKSLSMPILIDSLASEPDMTQTMSLLTHLKYTPISHPYIKPINVMLTASYFKKYKYREALKVFNWMVRPDSPSVPDEKIYGILINGFWRNGFVFEALKVLRSMVGANMVPSCASKESVYRALLREARIREAVELNDALSCSSADEESSKRILRVLENIIANWTD